MRIDQQQEFDDFFSAKVADYVATSDEDHLWFTAAEVSAATTLGDVPTVSALLQEHRNAQGVLNTLYEVACWNRGPRSLWIILHGPNLDVPQASEHKVEHWVLSYLKEEVKPAMKNVRVEFLPGILSRPKQPTHAILKAAHSSKMDAYAHTMMTMKRTLAAMRPVALRGRVRHLDAVLDNFIAECDLLKAQLDAL